MTENEAARRPRLSRRAIRAWASAAGLVAFLVPAAALARSPEPRPPAEARRVEVIRRLVRRIVVAEERAHEAPVRYVVAGGAAGGPPPVTWTRGS